MLPLGAYITIDYKFAAEARRDTGELPLPDPYRVLAQTLVEALRREW